MEGFEWDEGKAELNWRLHEVLFTDAAEVFDDPCRLNDPDYYEGEDRWRTVGMVRGEVLLAVVYTITDEGKIRFISARHVEPYERRRYGNRKF